MPTSELQVDLSIDDEAADYARGLGGVLTIRPSPRHGCCGGRVDLASVDTERPADTEAYVNVEQSGLAVYVYRSFVALNDTPLHVGLDQLLGWKSLYVEGASAQM